MIKIIGFAKKKEGLTIDEFSSYWQEKHAPLGFEILPDDIKITTVCSPLRGPHGRPR